MKDDKYFFKYSQEPGREKNKILLKSDKKPLVSIITSYYNGNEFMDQTINCVLNQTFPYWEWIIVDDGSTKEDAIEYLKRIEEIDDRIHIYHKENGGLATGRDYAIKYATTDYILPLDSDDLIENTFIETLYWTMETNKDATWAYASDVGFGKWLYVSDKKFDSELMKTENHITATSLIRKEKILELKGYSVAKRYVNEDWHLWLRMLQKGYYPVKVNFYGFWYRRKKESLLTRINDEKNEENKLRLRDLKIEADKIKNKVSAKMYPIDETEEKENKKEEKNRKEVKNKKEKVNIYDERFDLDGKTTNLYIIKYVKANKKLVKLLKKNTDYNSIIVSIEKNNKSQYIYRQEIEKYGTYYDLTSFLDKCYYKDFIEYLHKKYRIDNVYVEEGLDVSDCLDKKSCRKLDYKDNESLYKFKIFVYKFNHLLPIRAIRKFGRKIIGKDK